MFFVVSIRYDQVFIADTPTPIGEFVVLSLILLFTGAMTWVYQRKKVVLRNILGGSFVILAIAFLISEFIVHFNLVWVQWGVCALVVLYLVYLSLAERQKSYILISLFTIGSIGFMYSSDYVFDNILELHQRTRIKVVLGLQDYTHGTGYTVNH